LVERSASLKKPIKTNTDKEKQVFICFVRLSVFVGFSLFLLVFEKTQSVQPTIKKYCRGIEKYLPTFQSNFLENLKLHP